MAPQAMVHNPAKDHTGIPPLRATAHLHHLCCYSGSKMQVTPKCCSPPRNLTQVHDPSQSFFNQLPMQGPFKVPFYRSLITPNMHCIVPGN